MRDLPTPIATRYSRVRSALFAGVAAGLLCAPDAAWAQPSADQVLSDMGLSDGDKQRVLSGEFVTAEVAAVSERDLSFAIAFLVKTTPDALSKQILAGDLVSADAEVQTHGEFKGAGSLADLAGLQISGEEVKALAGARAGDAVNLSAAEIAAFRSAGGAADAVQQELRKVLLARHRAYRVSGLAGIAPYDRGGGRTSDPASDLKKAAEAAGALEKYLPVFQKVLLGYPKATVPGLQESFFWVKSVIQGKPTYVLTHLMAAQDGAARAVVRREYYVSTGYNAEQSIAGLLPVQGGTIVAYTSHAFTDQVTGFGGSLKRSIGTRIMAGKMKEIFEAGRKKVGQ